MLKDHGLVWWSAGRSCSPASSLCASAGFFSITNYSNTILNRLSVCFLHRFACTWHIEKKEGIRKLMLHFARQLLHTLSDQLNWLASVPPVSPWCDVERAEKSTGSAGTQEKVAVHQRLKCKSAKTVYWCVPFPLAFLATVKQQWHTVLIWASTRSTQRFPAQLISKKRKRVPP